MYENNWQEEEMPISKIKQLLEDGYEIEVDSPDGFIPVNFFIDKGNWQEFILELDNGETVKCNENHLFETINGWKFAKQLINENTQFLTKGGWVKGIVSKTDNIIPIVDINVEHDNHRYYTNGVSSHNTGVGKSLMMCFVAANAMMLGKNVMYITMEMSEEMISERIDANLMDLRIQDVEDLKKSDYLQRIDKLKSKTIGKLLVKEFPTASANSSHFRALLREARIKKKFEPDLLVVDYLNICASSRMKMANNSYNYVKAIAEELRGLAMEFNVPLLSATQATRDANGNSDMDLKDTSESWGLPSTADFMFAMISNEDYEERKQVQFKQLKNRFNDTNYYKRFLVGVDRSKMKLFDLDNETVEVKELTEFDKPATQDKSFNSSKYKDLLT